MKKNSFLKNFIIGGCVGTTLIILSYIFTNLIMGNLTEEILNIIKIFTLSYLGGGICYTIARRSIKKVENTDTRSITRQKLLKVQLISIFTIIVYFSILLVIFILQDNSINIILSLSFIMAFGLWEYGCLLAYLNLKNNMVMIKRKNFKNNIK